MRRVELSSIEELMEEISRRCENFVCICGIDNPDDASSKIWHYSGDLSACIGLLVCLKEILRKELRVSLCNSDEEEV